MKETFLSYWRNKVYNSHAFQITKSEHGMENSHFNPFLHPIFHYNLGKISQKDLILIWHIHTF